MIARMLLVGVTVPSAVFCLAQTTNISGTVNAYARVTELNVSDNTVTLLDASAFAMSDRVLLIQMKGASINTNNSSSYGNITDYASAGLYELNTVCDISDDVITLERLFENSYSVGEGLQLIRIPQYVNANITGTLTGSAWNGTTGGVIAIEASGQVTFNANINAAGIGFQAAPRVNSGFSCSWANQQTAFLYNPTTGSGAWKGEGVAGYISSAQGGKGKKANGGGGGNDHNSGGGGGGNYGNGGPGGTRSGEGTFGCHGQHPGVGGLALTYSNSENRIFMGGGGGAGHENNSQGANAGAGGGVVIIIANSIAGNSYSILANGTNAQHAQSDGAPGGGGGGTVVLDVSNWGSTNLYVDAGGGNGGNSSTAGDNHCMGPGGGGGGGTVWVSGSSFPSNVLTDVAGGVNGICMSVTTTCPGYMNGSGATSGADGGTLTQLSMPESSGLSDACQLLPVYFMSFTVTPFSGTVGLTWTIDATDLRHFDVEHSTNGTNFTRIQRVPATGKTHYSAMHEHPSPGMNYYRVKAIASSSAPGYSHVSSVSMDAATSFDLLNNLIAADNPTLHLTVNVKASEHLYWSVVNALGQVLTEGSSTLSEGVSEVEVQLGAVARGKYLLRIESTSVVGTLPFVVK